MYRFTPDEPPVAPNPLAICFLFSTFCAFPAHLRRPLSVITHIVNMTLNLPPELIQERLFGQFPGWTWSQRSRDTNSWIWNEGYDIQRESIYRWVWKACVALNRLQFANFKHTGLQNCREHLWREPGLHIFPTDRYRPRMTP
jgi:hypothetical protein